MIIPETPMFDPFSLAIKPSYPDGISGSAGSGTADTAGPPERVVVMGASAGGLCAIKSILSALSAPFPFPIVVVLHVPMLPRVDFTASLGGFRYVRFLEAEEKTFPSPGGFYLAPAGYHLLFEADRSFALSNEPPVNWARPAADVLFETAAAAFGRDAVGVVLSGGNRDGAAGLACLKAAGAFTLVQDPLTAEVDSMPCAALEMSKPDEILSPEGIGARLALWANHGIDH